MQAYESLSMLEGTSIKAQHALENNAKGGSHNFAGLNTYVDKVLPLGILSTVESHNFC